MSKNRDMIITLVVAMLMNAIFMTGNFIFGNNKIAILNAFAIVVLVIALILNL